MNGESKWLSRTLWFCVYLATGAFVLAWKLNDGAVFTVVATALATGWFAGKGVDAYQKRAGGS